MPEDAPKPRPDKTLRWMTVILVAIVVIVGGYLTHRWALQHALEKRYAAIRAAGYPVTLKELADWYPTPPIGLNAADIYQQAFLKYSDEGADNENLPVVTNVKLPELGEPIPPEMLAAIREYLAANEEALKLLHEAATYEECRYPIDLRDGYATLLPHLADCRQAVRLLHLEAILKTEDGDPEGAARAVMDSLAAANSLRMEPIFVPHLVQIACSIIACASCERVLSRAELTDLQLTGLTEAFRNAETLEGMLRAFVGERCVGISTFENPSMLASVGALSNSSVFALQFAGLLEMDAKEYVDIMNVYVATARAPLSERGKLADEIDKRVENTPRWCLFSRMLLPALSRCVNRDLEDAARLRCAATAAAVARYRLTHGEFPARLDALVPKFLEKVPEDPFSGAPLLYKLTDDGCVIYSVGENEKDDGGVEYDALPEAWRAGENLDLPFRLLRRELRPRTGEALAPDVAD